MERLTINDIDSSVWESIKKELRGKKDYMNMVNRKNELLRNHKFIEAMRVSKLIEHIEELAINDFLRKYNGELVKVNTLLVAMTPEEQEIQHIKLNLLEKEDVIKYALLLQQEGVEICHRVDFYNTVEVRHGYKREEIDVYDGDIIFCTDKDRFTWDEKSGAYVCIDGCYKRLMYTPGRGYICRGEPDYEQNRDGKDCRYNDYVFNSYDRRFQIVGNIFVDNSVLNEKKEETK